MITLSELQNSKALLKKRRPAEPTPPPDIGLGTLDIQTSTHKSNAKTNIPLPTISLQALASARVGLHKVSTTKSVCLNNGPRTSPQADDQDQVAIPTFSRRKELFEKQKTQVSNSFPATALVRVGDGNETKTFTVSTRSLRSLSRFRDDLWAGIEQFSFPDHSPIIFQLFFDFCQEPQEFIKYHPGRYSAEPWVTSAAAAYVLAVDLRARRFERYALSQFIQNCAIVAKGPWKYIEESVVTESALSRFSRHWVAWNTSLSNLWTHEYIGLEAASLAENVTPETRDPRIFDIDHWYQDCGEDMNATCEHNPVHRKQQREREARVSRAQPVHWGAEYERRAQ